MTIEICNVKTTFSISSPILDGPMKNQEPSYVFIVEGTIQALRVSPGIVNLIADIQKGAFFTGVIAGLAGEAGVSANLASLATYDGEDVEHIALLINGILVIGTFEWLRDLNVGDNVKLVVSEIHEGPLFAHAILRQHDQLLWTPFSVDHTCRGWIFHAIKLGLVIFTGTWLMLGSFYLFGSRPQVTTMLYIFGFSVAMITFVIFMSTRDVMHLGDQAEDIFRLLDVPKFDRFRIKPYSVLKQNIENDPNIFRKGHIFHFSDALAAHKKKFNLS
jgi:hypothetical protein